MNPIIEFFNQDIPSIVIGFFMILSAFIAMYEIIGKVSVIIGKPVKWVKKKNEDHELLRNTINKVDNLEKKDDAIKEDIDDILVLLREHVEADNKRTRATFRSSLYRMHSDFTSQGFITREGLKTFLECGKAYEEAGGKKVAPIM